MFDDINQFDTHDFSGSAGDVHRSVQTVSGELKLLEPMSRHSSWRVGGVAKKFYQPEDLEDLTIFLQGLDKHEPILWVGLGSNLLVRDGGFNGIVISLAGMLDEISLLDDKTLYVESGLACPKVARYVAQQKMSGAEFLAGIPGTMGGALTMNAGAFGSETWDIVKKVRVINRKGQVIERLPDEYTIGYRSVKGYEEEWFVSCVLRLESDEDGASAGRIQQLLQRRTETQPIGQPSCGSVFTNPPGEHAAHLIEQAGLKGYRTGGAVVSEKHANFIINEEGATAADIESLIKHVQQVVYQIHGIRLQTEVRIVGDAYESGIEKT